MAGYQPGVAWRVGPFDDAGDDDGDVGGWIAGRNADLALRQGADLVGRRAWSESTRTGENLQAPNPADVTALGAPSIRNRPAPPTDGAVTPPPPQPFPKGQSRGLLQPPARVAAYGALRANLPSDQELADLRKQQTSFADKTRKLDLEYSWLAVPALLPPLVALGLEGAAAWAARSALPAIERAPLDLVERDPYLRVGDNWATRAGRRAHAALRERLDSKDGWDYEPKLTRPGQRPLRPDAGTPARNPAKPESRKYLELKPNTPDGRTAAARAVKRYKAVTEDKVRPIYYDQKDFM
jgi:hypothetical protein